MNEPMTHDERLHEVAYHQVVRDIRRLTELGFPRPTAQEAGELILAHMMVLITWN